MNAPFLRLLDSVAAASKWFKVEGLKVSIPVSERVDEALVAVGEWCFLLRELEGKDAKPDQERSIEVILEAKDGGIRVDVYDPLDWESRRRHGKKGEDGPWTSHEIWLGVAVAMMVAIWLAVRLAFNVLDVAEGDAGAAPRAAPPIINEEF